MFTTTRRLLATGALAVMLALSLAFAPASVSAAPRGESTSQQDKAASSKSRMKHVVKHRSPRSRQLKPYKYQRAQRYSTASTQKPSAAPCAVVGTDSSRWPSGIVSCY